MPAVNDMAFRRRVRKRKSMSREQSIRERLDQMGARQAPDPILGVGEVSALDPIGVYYNVPDPGHPKMATTPTYRSAEDGEVQLLFVGAIVDSERFALALDMRTAGICVLPPQPRSGDTAAQLEWLANVSVIEVRLLPR